MDVKKFYLLVLSFIICILSISAINATEDTENENVISVDNNLETNVLSDDVSDSEKNSEIILKENDNDEEYKFRTEKTTTVNGDTLTFIDLNSAINSNSNSTIDLSNNYKYNNAADSEFVNGIYISPNLIAYDNELILNENNTLKVWNITNLDLNVKNFEIIPVVDTGDGPYIERSHYRGTEIYMGNITNHSSTDFHIPISELLKNN